MGASKAWSSAAAAWLALAVALAAVVSSSEAYVFYAGGRDGWVLGPTESYNHWASRNRFQVNDTIVFTHEEGVSSVLLVTEKDYDACSTGSPVRRLEAVGGSGGRSVFRFDRSGPFFFISSGEDRCQKGQKLYIIVMAPRPPVAAAPAPAPGGSPQWTASPPAGGAAAPAPGGSSQWTASPPAAGGAAPPPMWASAPEYARGPGMSAMGASGREGGTSLSSSLGAPPPTAGASRSVGDAIVGSVAGVVAGVLMLCML
ncbi:unnamed protein product [Urochloa decumbens]|uniref:Phytocyanin domain-containing protein n=1 Tax=Urochloa decumbens TaxID=240449 RepID=A0ABC8ZLX1_9POAL